MLAAGLDSHPLQIDGLDLLVSCMGPYDDWLRAMILAHKEHSAWSLARPLGELLSQATRDLAARGDWDATLVLVPIPSRRSTVRRRGHNPSLRMAREATMSLRRAGYEAQCLDLLQVRLPVQDSVGLRAAARRRNLEDAFAVRHRARTALDRIGGEVRIVLCDDVTTSGATLREAQSALVLAGLPAAGASTIAAVF